MSRPLRIEFEGAYYHVMNRGLAYQPIFRSRDDRLTFLDTVTEVHDCWGLRLMQEVAGSSPAAPPKCQRPARHKLDQGPFLVLKIQMKRRRIDIWGEGGRCKGAVGQLNASRT